MATDDKLLFHLSDIHFGLEDNRAIDWVKQEIAEQRPDAVAITGDLTMRARHREFAAATSWIQSLDVPVTVEVGNHDMPYFNLFERFFAPYKRFCGMSEHVEREIDLQGLAIVPLKTAVRAQPRFNWSKGWVTRAALKKCLAAIDALPPGARALLAVHPPLRDVGTQGTPLTMRARAALRAPPGRGGHQRPWPRCLRHHGARRLRPGPARRSGHAVEAHPFDPAQLQRTALGWGNHQGLRPQPRECRHARHDDRRRSRKRDAPASAGRTGGAGASGAADRSAGTLEYRPRPREREDCTRKKGGPSRDRPVSIVASDRADRPGSA